jgi:hypothetical protein
MEIELTSKILAAQSSPSGEPWVYEPPWRTLSQIGRDLKYTTWDPSFMTAAFTGKIEVIINQGWAQAIKNKKGEPREIIKPENKDLWRYAFSNLQKAYPDQFSDKSHGVLTMHFFSGELKKISMTISK